MMKVKYEDIECGDIIECFDGHMIVEQKKDGFVLGHKLGGVRKGIGKEFEVLNRDFRYKEIRTR